MWMVQARLTWWMWQPKLTWEWSLLLHINLWALVSLLNHVLSFGWDWAQPFRWGRNLKTINLCAWQWKTRHNLYFACGVQLVAACCVSMWSLLCIYVTHTHTPVHINSYRKHATKYCSMVWTRKLRNVYAETPWLYAAVHIYLQKCTWFVM